MNDIRYNSALINSQHFSLPILLIVTSILSNTNSEIRPLHQKVVNYYEQRVEPNLAKTVFGDLPSQMIELSPSKMEILSGFLFEMLNDNKDLESEIIDMVNRKFEKLLLKI